MLSLFGISSTPTTGGSSRSTRCTRRCSGVDSAGDARDPDEPWGVRPRSSILSNVLSTGERVLAAVPPLRASRPRALRSGSTLARCRHSSLLTVTWQYIAGLEGLLAHCGSADPSSSHRILPDPFPSGSQFRQEHEFGIERADLSMRH